MRRYKKYPLYSMGTPSGIPTVRRASLRFTKQITLTSSPSSIFAAHPFAANSLFSPDGNMEDAGSRGQPYSFDTYKSLYGKYVVVGSRCSVKILLQDVGQNGSMVCGVHLDTDKLIPAGNTYPQMVESRKGSWVAATNQRKSNTVSSKFSARKFFNIKDVKDNVDDIGAAVTAGPAQRAYFIVWSQNVKAGHTNACDCIVTIDYLVDFSDPKDLAKSSG